MVQSKVEEFLSLVSNTLESYLHTYKDEVPQEVEDETQFVLALCGVITSKDTRGSITCNRKLLS